MQKSWYLADGDIEALRTLFANHTIAPLTYGLLTFHDNGTLLRVDGPIAKEAFAEYWSDGSYATIHFLYGIDADGWVTEDTTWVRPILQDDGHQQCRINCASAEEMFDFETSNFNGTHWDPIKELPPYDTPPRTYTQRVDHTQLYTSPGDQLPSVKYHPLMYEEGSVNMASEELKPHYVITYYVFSGEHSYVLSNLYLKLKEHVWALEVTHGYTAGSMPYPYSYGTLTFNDVGELVHVDGPIAHDSFMITWDDSITSEIRFLYGVDDAGWVIDEPWLRPREIAIPAPLREEGWVWHWEHAHFNGTHWESVNRAIAEIASDFHLPESCMGCGYC